MFFFLFFTTNIDTFEEGVRLSGAIWNGATRVVPTRWRAFTGTKLYK